MVNVAGIQECDSVIAATRSTSAGLTVLLEQSGDAGRPDLILDD